MSRLSLAPAEAVLLDRLLFPVRFSNRTLPNVADWIQQIGYGEGSFHVLLLHAVVDTCTLLDGPTKTEVIRSLVVL